mgnify:FL=1|tara:strand:- start:533 stop:961 length:429 start_codon:yes stop_codon:yes gene_type:complete
MIRDMKKIDEDFIYHSWLYSVKNPNKAISSMTRYVIDDVVANNNIRICCNDEDENHILGWIAYGKMDNTPLLHFIFIKKALRGNGLATDLVRDVFPDSSKDIFCTYWSHYLQKIDAKRKWNARFDGKLLAAHVYFLGAKDAA